MQKFGIIPEKIKFVYCAEKSKLIVGADFENKDPIMGYETYPIDADNKKTLVTAEKAAAGNNYDYNTRTVKVKSIAYLDRDNTPISNVKVLSFTNFDSNFEYKILVDDFCVHMNVQTLLETMQSVGVKPNGILNGEFIFASVDGRMNLIRVGSELYNQCLDYTEKSNTKHISKKDLEFGAIYQNKKQEQSLFLGYVNSTSYRRDNSNNDRYVYGKVYKPSFNYKKTELKKYMLFYNIRSYDSKETQIESVKSGKIDSYSILCKKSHDLIEKVDMVELPENIIEILRGKAKNEILKMIGDDYNLEYTIEYKSVYLNMYKFGTFRPDNFDISKYRILT